MLIHAIAEFFGDILFSFTRSVAEHFDVDERENPSDLFGYNALEDTGREWYCQPIDEVIYQEYSNSEATTMDYLSNRSVNARLLDACSTEENEQVQKVSKKEAAMAWKRLRPSLLRTVQSSFYFGFLISVLSSAIVGLLSFPVYYFSYETQLNCENHAKESIPTKLQWVITITEIFSVSFLYYWFLLEILFYFRSFQISGIKLRLALVCIPFYLLDSFYRIAMQVLGISHAKLTPLQRVPAEILYFLSRCLQIYVLKRHFCTGRRTKHVKFILLFMVPSILTFFVAVIAVFFIYPAYNKQDMFGKVLITIFTPLITVVLKIASRFCIQRFWCRISHPGTSFVLLAPLYCGSALMLRLLQVDLQSLESVALIGVIHGIAEVIDRSMMALIDHICHQILENRKVPWGGFRTPRRERLAADISLMSMLFESSAVISLNVYLHLYQYFNTYNDSPIKLLQSFAITTSVPLAIEWFFTSVSIVIETRYQNIPVMAVWRKRWRRYIVVGMINMLMICLWAGQNLLTTVHDRFKENAKDHCKMPLSS